MQYVLRITPRGGKIFMIHSVYCTDLDKCDKNNLDNYKFSTEIVIIYCSGLGRFNKYINYTLDFKRKI